MINPGIRRRSPYLNEHPRTGYLTCCVSPFSHGHMAATRVCSRPYPFIPVRERDHYELAELTITMAVFRICAASSPF